MPKPAVPAVKKKDSKSSASSSQVSFTDQPKPEAPITTTSQNLGSVKIQIWPKWDDAEVNKETWTSYDTPKHTKQFFENPEGKLPLPSTLMVHTWKRPHEFIAKKDPAVVENQTGFDLFSPNSHLFPCELMRWLISEINLLWRVNDSTSTQEDDWKPWEHIFSLCEVVKGHVPLYNPFGKYVVRLYWMGAWRKITIDDSMPFDEKNNLLLPASTCQSELWPMLLAKALIRVASTKVDKDMAEFTFIHNLTGWIPGIIPIKTENSRKTWKFLQDILPEFKHQDESLTVTTPDILEAAAGTDSSLNDNKSLLLEQNNNKGTPEVLVCASFYTSPQQDTILWCTQTSNASETLRRYGLCLLHSNIVQLTRTRLCSLEPPPKPPIIPRWKLIRPQRKKVQVFSEPQKLPPVPKEEFIEVASPFLRHSVKSSSDSVPQQDVKKKTRKTKTFKSQLLPLLEMETEYEDTTEAKREDQKEDKMKVNREDQKEDKMKVKREDKMKVKREDQKEDKMKVNREDQKEDKMKVKREDQKEDRDNITTDTPSAMKVPAATESSEAIGVLQRTTWVDPDDFAKAFQTLLVFHKPQTYPHRIKKYMFRSSVLPKEESGSKSLSVACSAPRTLRWTYILCVESLQPSQILVTYSALLKWEEADKKVCRPALLLVQPTTWMDVWSKSPVLTIQTFSVKSAMLDIPEGRHLFSVHVLAPHGYCIELCSKTPFLLEDEHTIIPHFTKESAYFTQHASNIFSALTRVVFSFGNELELPALRKALEETYCPPNIITTKGAAEHNKIFNSAVYHMICEAVGRALTGEERFAVQALTADLSLLTTGSEEVSLTQNQDSKQKSETGGDRQSTDREVQDTAILQKKKKVLNATKPGTKENLKASEILANMWPKIESDADKHAAFLLRSLINKSREKVQLYSGLMEDTSRITFVEYSVSIQETSSSWILIFRGEFTFPEEMLLVTRYYTPVNGCLLYVINNDTGKEKELRNASSNVFKPNEFGYTFLAEAFVTRRIASIDDKWRLWMICSKEPLPKLSCESFDAFLVKEIQDYYICNDKNIICRYSVKVTTDLMGTIQCQTSNENIIIRLSVLDKGKEVVAKTRMGRVLLPVVNFMANKDPSEDEKNNTDHEYIVQMLMYSDSWDMDESQLAFMQKLKDERQRATTAYITNAQQAKEDEEETAAASNSAPKQGIDKTKPHWTLRIVTDRSKSDCIEVEDRAEQIKAIKRSWELADPGRSVRAKEARRWHVELLQRRKQEKAASNQSQDLVPGLPVTFKESEQLVSIVEKPKEEPALEKHVDVESGRKKE